MLFRSFPQESQGIKTVWRWGTEKASKNLNINLLARKHSGGFFQIIKKYRENTFVYTSVWNGKDIKTDKGTLQIKELFDNKKILEFAKPLDLINKLLKQYADDDDIILDFFAGSGTTAHAVMDLNKEDGGNRQFILVQMPEQCDEKTEAFKAGYKTISDISKERIRRAGKKIKEEYGKETEKKGEGLQFEDSSIQNSKLNTQNSEIDFGFKVFKLTHSNYKEWQDYTGADIKQLENLFENSIDPLVPGWKEEDVLTEIMLIEGFPLDSKIELLEEYTSNKILLVSSDYHEHRLIISLDKELTGETIKALSILEPDIFICLDFAITDEFKVRLQDKGRIKTI